MQTKFQFLDFDLSTKNETDINYVKIETSSYGYTFYRNSGLALPFSLVLTDQVFIIKFRTGQNKHQNYGFLLNYMTYRYPKVSIASNESAKASTLIAKGMYI